MAYTEYKYKYELSEEAHKERHNLLHNHLDELATDFFNKHKDKLPSETNLREFLDWSYEQTINPT